MKALYLIPLTFLGCDRSGDDLIPQPNGDFDAVIEIGELGVMTPAKLSEFRSSGGGAPGRGSGGC